MRVNVAHLVPRAHDESLRSRLKNLLQLGGVSGQITGGRKRCRALGNSNNLAGPVLRRDESHGGGIVQVEGVLQASGEEQGMDSGAPFAMITGEEVRHLGFGYSKRAAGGVLIVILE